MISKSIDATRTPYPNSVVGIVLFYKSMRQYFYVENDTRWPVVRASREASGKNKSYLQMTKDLLARLLWVN